MPAYQTDADGVGSLDGQPLLKERATISHVASGSREFEVVNVDHQMQFKLMVDVARRPLLRDGEEAQGAHVLVAMLLPESTAVRVP
eukprot:6658501-Heterocapsa_arctica.AAC.1